MKKDIYIIRNTVNDKVYIGQSVDYKYRFRKHCETARRNSFKYKSYLYNAMNEIGIEKFYVELLEAQIEDYNEKEIYYIKKFNSLRPNGYNLADGGDWYPHLGGVEHHSAKIHSIEELESIYEELMDPSLTLSEVAEHFGVNFSVIQRINAGQTYHNDNLTYPLKQCRTLTKESLDRLTYDLKYSNLSYKEIGDIYGISVSHVKQINAGMVWHRDYLDYPLRKMVFKGSEEDIEKIQKDLLSTSIDFEKLAMKFGCSVSTIKRINNGETHYTEGLKYPLRKIGKITSEVLLEIQNLLRNSSKSCKEIAAMYDVSEPTIKRINSGATKKYRNETINYPIRQI